MPNLYTNTPRPAAGEVPSKSDHLLGAIRATRESVGDSLNDDELTRLLLLHTELPIEAGFAFLSFCDGVVTLSVPQQDLAKWYSEKGGIAPEKGKIAKAIANKYQLFLCEPLDLASGFPFSSFEKAGAHHHLELATRRETVIIAHPKYLKVRMYCNAVDGSFIMKTKSPVVFGPDLLKDLSVLYRGELSGDGIRKEK